ncbi:Tsbp1 [Phodopus roborovskii]|uniref:Tsbp1 protein n=1 Tax=Phodopus roborovskii TaxID=109678 RepID=A0AAU9ZBM6_PHORO|nr:Tsbp1 [Phodopus roborovskii]
MPDLSVAGVMLHQVILAVTLSLLGLAILAILIIRWTRRRRQNEARISRYTSEQSAGLLEYEDGRDKEIRSYRQFLKNVLLREYQPLPLQHHVYKQHRFYCYTSNCPSLRSCTHRCKTAVHFSQKGKPFLPLNTISCLLHPPRFIRL